MTDQADTRRQIRALLKGNPRRSDRAIAAEVGAVGATVARIRRAMEASGDIAQFRDRGGRPKTKPAPPPEARITPEERAGLRATIVAAGLAGDTKAAQYALTHFDVPEPDVPEPTQLQAEPAPRTQTPMADMLAQRRASKRRSA